MTHPHTIAVVGGGIAGLAAAFELAQHGEGRFVPLVLEAGDQLGGKLQTEIRDGSTFELGPDAFLATRPAALELIDELDAEVSVIGTNPASKSVFLRRGDQLQPLPDGLTMMVPTDIGALLTNPLLSWRGKLRAGLEPLVPARENGEEESQAEFVARRFGAELFDDLLEPLMSGIYAGDGHRLSLEATFPLLAHWEREHGSVIAGARRLAARRRQPGKRDASRPRSMFLAPERGFGSLITALVARIGEDRIRRGCTIRSINQTGAGYRLTSESGETINAAGVIIAAPSFAAAEILPAFAPELASALREIEYASTATVNLAYRSPELERELDGSGYLVPRNEGRPALGCTWTSSKFPTRAPQGDVLIRVFLGRIGQDDLLQHSDPELTDIARAEIEPLLGLTRAPDVSLVSRWPRAMPQYNVGHLERIDRIQALASKQPRLALAGAAYRGIGIPACIESGRTAARSIMDSLAAAPAAQLEREGKESRHA